MLPAPKDLRHGGRCGSATEMFGAKVDDRRHDGVATATTRPACSPQSADTRRRSPRRPKSPEELDESGARDARRPRQSRNRPTLRKSQTRQTVRPPSTEHDSNRLLPPGGVATRRYALEPPDAGSAPYLRVAPEARCAARTRKRVHPASRMVDPGNALYGNLNFSGDGETDRANGHVPRGTPTSPSPCGPRCPASSQRPGLGPHVPRPGADPESERTGARPRPTPRSGADLPPFVGCPWRRHARLRASSEVSRPNELNPASDAPARPLQREARGPLPARLRGRPTARVRKRTLASRSQPDARTREAPPAPATTEVATSAPTPEGAVAVGLASWIGLRGALTERGCPQRAPRQRRPPWRPR